MVKFDSLPCYNFEMKEESNESWKDPIPLNGTKFGGAHAIPAYTVMARLSHDEVMTSSSIQSQLDQVLADMTHEYVSLSDLFKYVLAEDLTWLCTKLDVPADFISGLERPGTLDPIQWLHARLYMDMFGIEDFSTQQAYVLLPKDLSIRHIRRSPTICNVIWAKKEGQWCLVSTRSIHPDDELLLPGIPFTLDRIQVSNEAFPHPNQFKLQLSDFEEESTIFFGQSKIKK